MSWDEEVGQADTLVKDELDDLDLDMEADEEHTAPGDFGQFYTDWEDKVRTAIYVAGFYDSFQAEDMLQDIFEYLFTKRHLERYDPTISKFSTYTWVYVKYLIRNRKRSFAKQSNRETVVDIVGDIDANALLQPHDDIDDVEFMQAVEEIHRRLKEYPATKSKDLARLFMSMVKQVQETGTINQAELAREMERETGRSMTRQGLNYQVSSLANTAPLKEWRKSIGI